MLLFSPYRGHEGNKFTFFTLILSIVAQNIYASTHTWGALWQAATKFVMLPEDTCFEYSALKATYLEMHTHTYSMKMDENRHCTQALPYGLTAFMVELR